MSYSSLSSWVGGPKLLARRLLHGAPRLLSVVASILLALALGTPAAHGQSCAGMVAGQVCRPTAGGCDVAESCVSAGGAAGAAMYQPVDGTLGTNVNWSYTMGYGFTPNKTLVVTYLGGFFNGTKTVYLYDRSTGAVLASATVTAANGWAYAPIAPVTLDRDLPYSVGVYLAGSGAAFRSSMTSMPAVLADATINGSCYRPGSTAEPCASSGLVAGVNYGMADIKYLTTKGLYQPTDGTLYTEVNGDYMAGYAFTPNKNLTVTHLGGLYNGTKTLYLFNRSTGALLASVSNTSANAWNYARLPPIALTAGTSYTVAVRTGNSGAHRAGLTSMPSVVADAAIEGACYRLASNLEPCASSGLVSGNDYGLADIKYAPTGGSLACPADTFAPSGSVCRSASGTCDVAESCSGSSPACPNNAFVPAGLSCSDGAACTYDDVCNGAGSCGGTTITCGGGNACSTTACNGTSACEAAKVFCMSPPNECYNTLGTCSTTNGSCSYTIKVGASCGTRGTCQSNGNCYTPPQPTPTAVQGCPATPPTVPAPTPIGCDSCDASRPCVVDSEVVVPYEYQTCSGYTPRKGDVVLHEAQGLTQLMLKPFGSPWTHVGVFLDPQPLGSSSSVLNKQMVVHHALNQKSLPAAVLQASDWDNFLIGLKLDKNAAYCKSAKLNPATLFDQGGFLPGVPNLHQGDMTTESDGGGGLFWDTGVDNRMLVIAANRAAGEQVADRMVARVGQEYYSLNSLVDEAKGRARLSNGKPGTNCASALMSCITPSVPKTLLVTDRMRTAARVAYDRIRKDIRHMPKTEAAVSTCKNTFGCLFGLPCPVDCDGLAWEVSNGIADQVIACILFGPGANGCECTRDNRKWHYAAWASAPYSPPSQDELDWVNGRVTDIEFVQDPWTGSAAQGQPAVTVYPSYTYFPDDFMDSPTYPSGNSYDLKRISNATRRYGHCAVPLSLTATMSPAASYSGQPISWTATASGGTPASTVYAFFRRRGGTSNWIPDVTAPAWQGSRSYSWTPSSGDAGYTWDTYVWVKDGNTPPAMNAYGYAAGFNTGGVQVVSPPTLTATGSPPSSNYGTPISWTATGSGGVPSTRQYAFFRRRGGTPNWVPDVNAPSWQTSNVYTWTPTSADVAAWETYVWLKDSATPATMNAYGYAAGVNTGVVQVTSAVLQSYPPKGWVDGFNLQHVWGWACDPDYPGESNRVDFWTTAGQGIGSSGAYIGSSAAINSACGGGTAHYFDWYPSGGIASGTRFNVYSIDLPYGTSGGVNRKIGGSGAIGDGYEFVIP